MLRSIARRSKKFLSVLLMVGVLLLPTVALPFDSLPGQIKEFFQKEDNDFIDLGTSIFNITVIGVAEGLYPDYGPHGGVTAKRGTGPFGQIGSGMHIGKGIILTAYHVIHPQAVSIQISSNFSYICRVDRVVSMTIFVGNDNLLGNAAAEVIWTDPEHDIALLKVIGSWPALKDLGYRPHPTWDGGDMIHQGDVVFTIVAKRAEDGTKTAWSEVRWGKVLAPRAILPPQVPDPETQLPWFNMLDVTTDMLIYPGDSGSPVFAFENGEPILIGVVRACAAVYDEEGNVVLYSYFSRIDPVYPRSLER